MSDLRELWNNQKVRSVLLRCEDLIAHRRMNIYKKASFKSSHYLVVLGLVLSGALGGALWVNASTALPSSWIVYSPNNSRTLAFTSQSEAFDAFFAQETANKPTNHTSRCTRYAPRDEHYRVLYSSRYAKWVDGQLIMNCGPWPEPGGSPSDRWYGVMDTLNCSPNSTDPRCFVPFSPAVSKNAGVPDSSKPFSQGSVCCGNPINVGTGNKFQVEQDFEVPGSPWLNFSRYYNSQGNRAVGITLGNRWRHSFDYHLEFKSGGGYALHRPDGAVRQFGGSQGTPQDEKGIFDFELNSSGQIAGYYLLDTDGTKELYSSRGAITRIELPDGGWLNFEYVGATRRLARILDHNNRALVFAYDSSGRISTVTTPNNTVYGYAYNANGHLSGRTAPGGGARTYVYDEPGMSNGGSRGLLTRVTDETGKVVGRYAYDSRERAISSEGGGGANKFVVTYGTNGASFLTPSLAQQSFSFASYLSTPKATTASTTCPSGDCGAVGSESSSYDSLGNQISTTLANGTKTCRGFDTSRGLPTRIVEGLPASADCGAALASPPASARTVSIEWHPQRALPSRIAAPKLLTVLGYDNNGRLIDMTQSSTAGSGSGAEGFNAPVVGTPRLTTFTYDGAGRLLTVDEPRTDVNDVYSYVYDSAGNLASVATPLGKVTSFSNYDAEGRARQITEPGGTVSTVTYNPRGKVESVTRTGLTTSFTYLANGLLASETRPDGTVLTYGYDAANRLASITDEQGNTYQQTPNNAGQVTQASVLNSAGLVAAQLNQSFDALGRVLSMTGAHHISPTAVLLKP